MNLVAITIRNPLASEVVRGLHRDVSLNVYADLRKPVLIHTAGDHLRSHDGSQGVHAEARNALIGICSILQVLRPSAGRLATWRFKECLVFRKPIDHVPLKPGLFCLDDESPAFLREVGEAIASALSPMQAALMLDRVADPDTVHPSRSDGWVGD